MKAYKNINFFALGLPFALAILGVINEEFLLGAMLSTMITGFIQVCIGLHFFYFNPKNKAIQRYFLGVLFFFMLWFINIQIDYYNIITCCLFIIPLVLAIYLTAIIYKKI